MEELYAFNGVELAEKAGDARMLNIVLVGSLAAIDRLPIPVEILRGTIPEVVPGGTVAANLKAFDLGYQAVKNMIEAG